MTERRFAVVEVAATGTETSNAFVMRSGGDCKFQPLTEPTYPPHPEGEAFRAQRVHYGWSLRRAAEALGLSPLQVSGLEFGRYTFVDPNDWNEARDFFAKFSPYVGRAPVPIAKEPA